MPKPICVVAECERPTYSGGLCKTCYQRKRRNPETFNAPRRREADLLSQLRTLRQERDEARGKLRIAEQDAERRYAALWTVAQALWLRLSTSNGWLYMFRALLPREDTIPANVAALEAGKALGLGDD